LNDKVNFKEPIHLSEEDKELVGSAKDVYFYCTFSFEKFADTPALLPSSPLGLRMAQLVLKNQDPIEYFAFRDDSQLVFAHEISEELAIKITAHMKKED